MVPLRSCDFFSCVGNHAEGLHAAGPIVTTQFVEIVPYRRRVLGRRFPGVPIHDDINTYQPRRGEADIAVGGPPCQETSVAAAIHGKRTGASLWSVMLAHGLAMDVEWFVVEQPPGNAAWEAKTADDLARAGYHSARLEFAAMDLGAPHIRRRVFTLANRDLSRLQVAWSAGPSAVERVARASADRGTWSAPPPRGLRVAAGDGGGSDRRERIEAIGDSNPPAMMEVIGRCILATESTSPQSAA